VIDQYAKNKKPAEKPRSYDLSLLIYLAKFTVVIFVYINEFIVRRRFKAKLWTSA